VKPIPTIDSISAPAIKRGRKPGVKNKPKATEKMPKAAAKAKVTKLKVAVKPKATPAKRGPKPKIKAVNVEVKVIPAVKATKTATKTSKISKVSSEVKASTKRGPKPVAKASKAAKPSAKRGPKPKITLETVSDDGLPTLNKVLEAYAKSTGPRGKVGEIN
jgi:hypothetical protein